ncbi:hypothetical protein P7M47_08380 [Bisgaard Taxon 10/6]|nr:hypothetical protein [Exercitatus varius]
MLKFQIIIDVWKYAKFVPIPLCDIYPGAPAVAVGRRFSQAHSPNPAFDVN